MDTKLNFYRDRLPEDDGLEAEILRRTGPKVAGRRPFRGSTAQPAGAAPWKPYSAVCSVSLIAWLPGRILVVDGFIEG